MAATDSSEQAPLPFGTPPFFAEGVAAGFPAPAAGDESEALDLNRLCIRHPAATYFVRARGESMAGAGIADGDILVVDRSEAARNGDIIIAALDGEFTVKRFEQQGETIRLLPENPAFAPITLRPGMDAEFFGVVVSVVKLLRRQQG